VRIPGGAPERFRRRVTRPRRNRAVLHRWWKGVAVRDFRCGRRADPLTFLVVRGPPLLAAVPLIFRPLAAGAEPPFGPLLPSLLPLGSTPAGLPFGATASVVTTAIATRGLRCSRCGEHFAPPLFACPRCQQCDREVPAS